MRNAALKTLMLILLLLRPVAAQDSKESVVGLWLGESRTQGGLGNWLEFRADGTAEFGFGALVGALLDDTYQFDGVTLRLRLFSGKTTAAGEPIFESIQKRVRIDGDRAVVEPPQPVDQPPPRAESPDEQAMFERLRRPTTMTRVGTSTSPAAPIAGTWSYQHYTGQTAYETFTPGGRWYLRVPMQVMHGTYTVTGPAVIVRLPERSERFAREGDILMSGAAEGKQSTYRRAPD